MNTIREILRFQIEGMKTLGMKNPDGSRYFNCQDFVVQNGLDFTPPSEPFPHLMEQKQCFMNATNLVLINEERFVYCEGLVFVVIPIAHAWVWDRWEKTVVDPTLREPASEYLGIPFNTAYLKRRIVENGCYGLIDTYWDGWKLLCDPTTDWLAKDVTAA